MAPSPKELAVELLGILHCDLPRLLRVDRYYNGEHDDPYMPKTADAEYKLLASRATSNWMPLIVGTPAQALYIDGFRPSRESEDSIDNPEWKHWQRSKLDSRQTAIHRGALKHGHAFTVTEKNDDEDSKDFGKVMTRGLSALATTALFEDPANDLVPYAAITVHEWPDDEKDEPGQAWLWDKTHRYPVTFKSLNDRDSISVAEVKGKAHEAPECPVTRFAAAVDLEGRTVGVVEPLIELQNRINQTVFDLMVAQTYGSFKVRWVTGMAPPMKRNQETGEIMVDDDGKPIPDPIQVSAKRMLFGEQPDVKFGTLDETPLEGYIKSIGMSVQHLSAVSQTPPHYLLGEIANLSADALQAAETSLARKTQEFRVCFGEAWERVFRLAGALEGNSTSEDDEAGEVIWRDMDSRSMAQVADALGKLHVGAGIPQRGLWDRVPGVTPQKLAEWNELKDQEEKDEEAELAAALDRATALGAPKPVGKEAVIAKGSPGAQPPGRSK